MFGKDRAIRDPEAAPATRKKPTLETVSRLARALSLPISSLLEKTDASNPGQDQYYLAQVGSILRDKTLEEKQALVRILKSASDLTEK